VHGLKELLHRLASLDAGMSDARGCIEQLRQKIEELLAKAWYPAVFMGYLGDPVKRSALVYQGNTWRVVGVWDQVPVETPAKGCEVLLNRELSAIVARSRGLAVQQAKSQRWWRRPPMAR